MKKTLFLDIQEKEYSVYLFEKRRGVHELRDSRRYPRTDTHEFPHDMGGDGIEDACVSLPLSSLNFRIVDMPFNDRNKMREILPYELDEMILGGTEKAVFDNVTLSSSKEASQVLAVYAGKDFIGDLLARLAASGIDPVAVTCLELRGVLRSFEVEKLSGGVGLDPSEREALAREEAGAPTINLRRGEFSYTRDVEKTKKTLRLAAVLVVLLALVLFGDLIFRAMSARSDIASLKNEIRKMYQESFPAEKNIVNELHQFKAHMRELKEKEEFFLGVNPLGVLMDLSGIERKGVVFNELTIDRGSLTVKGEARSLSGIQDLKGELEGGFTEVNIADSKSSADGKMLFTITAKEKKG
jgi:type II secretory pathway component PulL